MNNTKTIFKSLLIMIVAISLFTVSCSKDEGGTTTPTTPAKPITITAQSITDGIKKALDGTVMKFTYTAPTSGNTATATATVAATKQDDLEALKNLPITISGATVEAKVASVPKIDTTTAITITITITPNSGNSFAETLTPYTTTDGTVKVQLTLKPEGSKNWNG